MLDKAPLPAPRPRPSRSQGRSLAALAGPLIRALHQVDTACMRALSGAVSPEQRACARLEVAMWAPLRRALTGHIVDARRDNEGQRIDVLLADDLLAFVDEVLLWVADVEAGGERRAARYLAACKERVGQLAALGGEVSALRAQVVALEKILADTSAPKASFEAQAAVVHQQIMAALKAHSPRQSMSLLDELTE